MLPRLSLARSNLATGPALVGGRSSCKEEAFKAAMWRLGLLSLNAQGWVPFFEHLVMEPPNSMFVGFRPVTQPTIGQAIIRCTRITSPPGQFSVSQKLIRHHLLKDRHDKFMFRRIHSCIGRSNSGLNSFTNTKPHGENVIQ